MVCTGAGHVQRGFETYARDLFERLRDDGGIDVTLLKGAGERAADERVINCIRRDASLNAALCRVMGDDKRYVIEYGSFCLAMLPHLVASAPDVVYVLEAPVYKFLRAWRRKTRARWKLVHFTGGQLARVPADNAAFLHHVTPCSLSSDEASAFPSDRQFVLPHFLDLRTVPPPPNGAARDAARRRLGLPIDQPILLSVGNLDVDSKRMDYLVREVAALRSRPYLVMLGQQDPQTLHIVAAAAALLGSAGYRVATVPRSDVWDYYAAADVFVLASMKEGFGLVYLEALASGLPVIAHDFDVSRFVLDGEGIFADLGRPGALAHALPTALSRRDDLAASRRRAYVRNRFDWSVLGPQYVRTFSAIANA